MSHGRPYLTLLLSAFAAFASGAAPVLEWDRAAIMARGEAWRLFTGHFVHWTPDHLMWDLLAFAVLGAVVEKESRRMLVLVVFVSALAISLLLLPDKTLSTYRGLSGIDSALLAAWLVNQAGRSGLKPGRAGTVLPLVLLFLFGAKSAFETVTGRTLFVEASGAFSPLPEAHLLGAAAGMLTAFCRLRFLSNACDCGGQHADS